MGVVLSPSYFYKKGSLYKTTDTCNKMLANANVNLDTPFALAFDGRNDERQKRSLLQTGTLVFPGDPKVAESVWQQWRVTDMVKNNLVKDAPLPTTSDLVEIEDLSEDSLPTSTDATFKVNVAEKFQQVGVDAAFKLLSASLTNLQNEAERTAILILDLSSRTLDFAKAAYKLKKNINIPIFYLGMAEGEGQVEWQRFHMSQWLSQGFLEGSLPLPAGAQPLAPAELPAELVTAMPAKPDLGTLTWSTKKENGLPSLKTPDKVLQAWHDHAEFGQQFQDWLKEARGKVPLDLTEDVAGNKKRTADSAPGPSGDAGSQKKKLRVDPAADLPMLPKTDLPSPLCWTAEVPALASGKKSGAKCHLMITIGKKIFLVNSGQCDLELSSGTIVAGYWKGSWQKGETEAREADVPFHLKDATDLVLMDGKVRSVGQILKDKRAISPLEVKILYHDMQDTPRPEDSAHFTLTLKTTVLFRPEALTVKEEQKAPDGAVTLPHSSVAGCLDTKAWDNLATRVLWSVKWTARGLSPVRPHVCLKANCKIAVGQAVAFQQPDSA